MNLMKAVSGMVGSAIGAAVATVATTAIGVAAAFATFGTSLLVGAGVGLILSVVNAQGSKDHMTNAAYGAVLSVLGYLVLGGFATFALPAVIVAALTGVVMGWAYSIVSDAVSSAG